ncbi:hypothetical protein N8I77_005086 [Diaporthe amygdali]|uniref:DUF7730 domain-containing protein n=1 Tax=Phomopsis amygdali TaxID=1214568 RepID=A0AAD9SMF6_PHOAM|nr:hypothetical protein N8I77_005086 [Diaporthe amygdali]
MANTCDQATADSAFFTRLPPEVRVSILTAAFGGRTVHIQRCPPAVVPSQNRSGRAVGKARQWLGGVFSKKTKEKREEAQPAAREKQWWGCVCYRPPEDSAEDSPASETCLADLTRSQYGGRWSWVSPLEVPPELAVGAIGWLLTCRKAYNEGIKVLYASNTFHLRSVKLCAFGGLLQQIPAVGVPYITSVEFVLNRRLLSPGDFAALPKAEASEADILESTLSNIPRLMPSLQKLYLGFCADTMCVEDCESGHHLDAVCLKCLGSQIQAMAYELGQMGRCCDLELGLTSTVFERYRHEALLQNLRMGHPNWKPGMSSKCSYHPRCRFFWPAPNKQPDTESGTDETRESDVGYWISQSQYDFQDLMMHCFGT